MFAGSDTHGKTQFGLQMWSVMQFRVSRWKPVENWWKNKDNQRCKIASLSSRVLFLLLTLN